MKMHHIAFWTHDVENLKQFYETHFQARQAFRHQDGDFESVFLSAFGGIHLELMTRKHLGHACLKDRVGHSHLSVEVDSKAEVDKWTDHFIAHGIPLEKIKQQYEDGFYESSVFDPDGNIIEIAYIDRTVNNTV